MDNDKSMYKIVKVLCFFVVSQLVMLMVLNFIPLGSDYEWTSICREWIENITGLS